MQPFLLLQRRYEDARVNLEGFGQEDDGGESGIDFANFHPCYMGMLNLGLRCQLSETYFLVVSNFFQSITEFLSDLFLPTGIHCRKVNESRLNFVVVKYNMFYFFCILYRLTG